MAVLSLDFLRATYLHQIGHCNNFSDLVQLWEERALLLKCRVLPSYTLLMTAICCIYELTSAGCKQV